MILCVGESGGSRHSLATLLPLPCDLKGKVEFERQARERSRRPVGTRGDVQGELGRGEQFSKSNE